MGSTDDLLHCPFCGAHPSEKFHNKGCYLGELIQNEWGSPYFMLDTEDQRIEWNKRYEERK